MGAEPVVFVLNGILNWSFWAHAWWKPQAALFDKDWHPTPAGRAWTDLVQRQWQADVEGKTAADGTFECRGFTGDYRATATINARSESTSARLEAGQQVVHLQLH